MSAGRVWQPWHRQAYQVVNSATTPVWLLMILFPRADITVRVRDAATVLHGAYGVAYAGFLAASVVAKGPRVDFRDGESVARGLSTPEGLLTGWVHFLTFDLFVGQWIHATGLEEGINTRVALFFTWMAGPLGLTLFLLQRRLADRHARAGAVDVA